MKTILFLGTSLVGSQYLRSAVELLGCTPIFLLRLEEYSGDAKKAIEQCEHYEADVNSLVDLRRAIEQNKLITEHGVVAITSLLDETFQNACALAKEFNLQGPDPALANLTDKTKVQQMIPEFSPPSIIFDLESLSQEMIASFFDQTSSYTEFLLKPAVSSGAVGVFIINKDSTAKNIQDLVCLAPIEDAAHKNWLIQPRIQGRLHSLEGFVQNGQPKFLGFSRRVRKGLTESASEFPVDDELSLPLQERCYEAVTTLVAKSAYQNGYFHCEFIINPDLNKAYFIDGNMGRVAGAAIIQQLALVYGKEPTDILKHVFDLGLFQGQHTSDFTYERTSNEKTLSINYCIAESATISAITAPANLSSFHTRVAEAGKLVLGVGTSDSAWVGFLAGFKDKVLSDIETLRIQTTQGPLRPFYLLDEEGLTQPAPSVRYHSAIKTDPSTSGSHCPTEGPSCDT